MKIAYATKAEAQAVCDRIHADLIASNPDYAKSAQVYIDTKGKAGTACWCVPFQEYSGGIGEKQVLVSDNWYVSVDERSKPVLAVVEVATVAE